MHVKCRLDKGSTSTSGIFMKFVDLGLSERIASSLTALGFEKPTEIQGKAIPAIFSGRDIMASAETGSGKTAAYALPIIQGIGKQIPKGKKTVQALILVPTRELAIQVHEQFKRFSLNSGIRSACIYGGTRFERQTRDLDRGVDIIVATPGRLNDHIGRGNVDLISAGKLVLDEADRMLDMGFMPQVRQIVKKMTNRRQTLMFSATISKGIVSAAEEFLAKPVTIRVNTNRIEPKNIIQNAFLVAESDKEELLLKLLTEQPDLNSVLVFARTRAKATRIRKKLCAANVPAEEIHGNISQNRREKTLLRYRKGEFSVLVATDVAARGLDVPEISHVVNYDLPDQAEDYVHRIGRTGRAGRSGVAYSFVCSNQRHLVREIEKVIGRELIAGGDRSNSKSKPKTGNPKEKATQQQPKGKARPTRSDSTSNSKSDATRSKTKRAGNMFGATKSKTQRPKSKSHHSQTKPDANWITEIDPRAKSSRSKKRRRSRRVREYCSELKAR